MTVSETLNGLVMEKLAARSRSVLMDGATKAVRNASYNAGRLNKFTILSVAVYLVPNVQSVHMR